MLFFQNENEIGTAKENGYDNNKAGQPNEQPAVYNSIDDVNFDNPHIPASSDTINDDLTIPGFSDSFDESPPMINRDLLNDNDQVCVSFNMKS